MGVLRSLVDVYHQITYLPEGDKRFTTRYASKNCPVPTNKQLRELFPPDKDFRYKNPFWSDSRVLSEDKTAVTAWQYANAMALQSRGTNTFYFLFIILLHVAASLYLWINVSSFIATISLAAFVSYDLFWAYLLRLRARFNKYILQMFRRSLDSLIQQSQNAYQIWLEELRESNFSQFIQIQSWHQQELLLEESRRQTRALNSAAASAALTAFNSNVIRNNQPKPFKSF